jgi:lysyl-tRNA synthetase class 2
MTEKELLKERREKLDKLIKQGIDVFGRKFKTTTNAKEIITSYKQLEKGEHSKDIKQIAGRITSVREHGKLIFMDIEDFSGKIQLCIESKAKPFYLLQQLQTGDFIGVKGNIYKSNRGEISVWVKDAELLCKSLRPLPTGWYKLKDPEIRYRQRYADMASNPEIRELFVKRAKIISAMRTFLQNKGFIEVQTPTLQPIYGGALAEPFETYHNELKRKMYLSISPELYLKRAIVGGFEKVFEIAKNFRNEGIDTKHNPEFTMMESYWAYADYNDNMKLTEQMLAYISKKVLGTTKVVYNEQKIDLKPPWPRITMYNAIKEHLGIGVKNKSEAELKKIAKEQNIQLPKYADKGIIIAELFEQVESKLIQPTFITDFPVEVSPLAKAKKDDPSLTERFELIITGQEFANAYTELNNPIEQAERFKEQANLRRRGDKEAHPIDNDFVRALEYGMPPTSGLGIGVDRLVMLLTDKQSIREVIMFPVLKDIN